MSNNHNADTTKNPGLLLHAAIERNNFAECQRLLEEHGSAVSNVKNRCGSTPLMLAANGKCGKNNSKLLEILLVAGAGESAAERNRKGKTAADIAQARGAKSIADRLRALEKGAAAKENFQRCKICQAKLRRRSKLEFIRDQVSRGEENNPLLLEFFRDDVNSETATCSLARTEFHRINSCIAFRKELSESMALISELKRLRHRCETTNNNNENNSINDTDEGKEDSRGLPYPSSSWKGWHIIDLCSGSSLTSAVALHLLPDVTITAVDMVEQKTLPHFEAAGFGQSQFTYLRSDINDSSLIPNIQKRSSNMYNSSDQKTTTVVFGMHCCGTLSLRAIEIFQELRADAILLMPCCLPPKVTSDSKITNMVYGTNEPTEQYLGWAEYLKQSLGGTTKDRDDYHKEYSSSSLLETNLDQIEHVLSPRNALITGVVKIRKNNNKKRKNSAV